MVPIVHWRPLEEIQERSVENHSCPPALEPPGSTTHAAGATEAPSPSDHSPENCSCGQEPQVQPPPPVNITEVFKWPLGCTLGPASHLLEKAGPYKDPTSQQVQINTPQVRLLRLPPPPSLEFGLHIPCLSEEHPEIIPVQSVALCGPNHPGGHPGGTSEAHAHIHVATDKHARYGSAQTQDQ